MATYEELQGRILRMVGDSAGTFYSQDNLQDAINAAFDAILPWCPKLGTSTITGDDSTASFSLPAGCYDVEAIVSSTGEVLARMVFAPGSFFNNSTIHENLWVYAPDNKVMFAVPPSSDTVYTVHYLQQWTRYTENSIPAAAIDPPDWTCTGVTLYAAAYLLLPQALDTANLRQYAMARVDSGTPEHNPLQKAITYLLTLFSQEMNRHPRYQRAQA